MKGLLFLDLTYNQLTDEALAELQKALPDCQIQGVARIR
jgi:hypothetical protein